MIFSEDALSRLEAEAARRGVSIEVIIDESASGQSTDSYPKKTLGPIRFWKLDVWTAGVRS